MNYKNTDYMKWDDSNVIRLIRVIRVIKIRVIKIKSPRPDVEIEPGVDFKLITT